MSRCVGAAGERPQVSFYVDPIAIVREVIKQNGSAAMVGAMLPVLGVDGIQGVGGSIILRPEEFDSITHMHLLLSNPRRVLLEVVRPKSGSTDPEEWVCEDVGSYVTGNWDVNKTLKAVEKIFDNFQGEGAFQEKGFNKLAIGSESISKRNSWINWPIDSPWCKSSFALPKSTVAVTSLVFT